MGTGGRLMKIDSSDVNLIIQMYQWAPTITELGTNNRKRLYRLCRAGLCRCDHPGQHPFQPICWSLLPAGTALMDKIDAEYGQQWKSPRWSITINMSAWIREHQDYCPDYRKRSR